MARITKRHHYHGGGRLLRRSREEKRRQSEGGGGAPQEHPQLPAEDDCCPANRSEINMDGISDQEVATAYSFVFSFDEVHGSVLLEEGQELHETKWSLDAKITSMKVSVKAKSPSSGILRRIKSATRKSYELQEQIDAHKSLLNQIRLKIIDHEARHRDYVLIVARDVEAHGDPTLGYLAYVLRMG